MTSVSGNRGSNTRRFVSTTEASLRYAPAIRACRVDPNVTLRAE